MLKALSERRPDYHVCYVDCAILDLSDCAMPVIDKESMTTQYAPSVRFGLGKGQTKPVLLMLDELGKVSRPILNMLLPVLLERRLGDAQLPVGSIVFATTNLDGDGLSDSIPAHAYNRMTVVDVANPTAEQWVQWGAANNIMPEVLAFARQYPTIFQRYDELAPNEHNGAIFNPRTGQVRAFCSPRSLEKASHLIRSRDLLGEALMPALIGTLGESAARDLEAFVHLADQVPSFDAVVNHPTQTKVPNNVGGLFLMAFMLSGRVTEETLDAVLEYVSRWDSFESTALFLHALASNPKKVSFACRNRAFTQMASRYGKFF